MPFKEDVMDALQQRFEEKHELVVTRTTSVESKMDQFDAKLKALQLDMAEKMSELLLHMRVSGKQKLQPEATTLNPQSAGHNLEGEPSASLAQDLPGKNFNENVQCTPGRLPMQEARNDNKANGAHYPHYSGNAQHVGCIFDAQDDYTMCGGLNMRGIVGARGALEARSAREVRNALDTHNVRDARGVFSARNAPNERSAINARNTREARSACDVRDTRAMSMIVMVILTPEMLSSHAIPSMCATQGICMITLIALVRPLHTRDMMSVSSMREVMKEFRMTII